MSRLKTTDRVIKLLDPKKCVWTNNEDYIISFGTKSTTFSDTNALGAYLMSKQNVSLDELPKVCSELIMYVGDNFEVSDEEDCGIEYIGTQDVLDEFFSYVRIEDSTHVYLVDRFPMKNFHFNKLLDDANANGHDEAEITMKNIPSLIDTYLSYLKSQRKIIPYKVDIAMAIDEYMENNERAELIEISKTISHKKQKIDFLRIFVEATIEDKSLWDAYYKILKHWMWCVKRNAIGKPIINQQLIVFTGAMGTGKSYGIDKWVGVFKKYVLRAKVSNIGEDRSAAVDSRKLIWIFDEMPHSNKADVDTLKTWTTSDEATYRPMGTNSSVTVKKRSMGIGSQNKPLSSTIQDSTGNRRFIDYPIKQSTNDYIDVFKEDHPFYDQFQSEVAWISMWKDVDENLEKGYVTFNEDLGIEKILNNNYTSTTECLFFKEVFIGNKETIELRRSIFYEMYKKFAQQYGNKPKANNTFVKDFENIAIALGFKYEVTMSKNVPYVTVPLLNPDYKLLFETIPNSTPSIMADGVNIFSKDSIYVKEDKQDTIKSNRTIRNSNNEYIDKIQDGYKDKIPAIEF